MWHLAWCITVTSKDTMKKTKQQTDVKYDMKTHYYKRCSCFIKIRQINIWKTKSVAHCAPLHPTQQDTTSAGSFWGPPHPDSKGEDSRSISVPFTITNNKQAQYNRPMLTDLQCFPAAPSVSTCLLTFRMWQVQSMKHLSVRLNDQHRLTVLFISCLCACINTEDIA